MMITLADLKDRYGADELVALTDRKGQDIIDVKVVNRAISDAKEEVASYLLPTGLVKHTDEGIVYALSVTVPKSLIIRCCDIARYYLHEDGVTDIVEKRYKFAIEWLKLVQKNQAMLSGVIDNHALHGNSRSHGVHVIANQAPRY